MDDIKTTGFDKLSEPEDCSRVQTRGSLPGMDFYSVFGFQCLANSADFPVNTCYFALEACQIEIGNELADDLLGAAEPHVERDVEYSDGFL